MVVRRSESGDGRTTLHSCTAAPSSSSQTAAEEGNFRAAMPRREGKEVVLEYCDRLIDEELTASRADPHSQIKKGPCGMIDINNNHNCVQTLGTLLPACCTLFSPLVYFVSARDAQQNAITGYQTPARVHDDFQEMMQPWSHGNPPRSTPCNCQTNLSRFRHLLPRD
jgi:hypothetical protein